MFPDMFQMFNEGKEQGEGSEGTEIIAPGSSSLSNVFVVSVGGSLIANGKPNVSAIVKFSECINELAREGYKFVVAAGGGKVARDYIAAAKSLGAGHFTQDEIGIAVTRINALLLTITIESAHNTVLTDLSRSKLLLEQGKTPIYGGMLPGFTTDAVAAILAEGLQGTFINLSNVDGIYSADPKTHPTARMYPELSYDRLVSLIKLQAMGPGQNIVVDLPAAMILRRSKIPALFLNGNDLENFKAAVRGMEFHGTIVKEAVEGESLGEEEPAPARRVVRRRARKKAEPVEEDEEEIDPDEIEL